MWMLMWCSIFNEERSKKISACSTLKLVVKKIVDQVNYSPPPPLWYLIKNPPLIKTHFIYAQLDWLCISHKCVLSHSFWLALFQFAFLLVDVISINFIQTLLTIPPPPIAIGGNS